MIQKIVLYLKAFILAIVFLCGPIVFFISEDKDFAFTEKAEVEGVIEDELTSDSIYYDYEIGFTINDKESKDTIDTYTFKHQYSIGDSVTILYNVSNPTEFRYKDKYDSFNVMAPLFFPLMVIIPVIFALLMNYRRKKYPERFEKAKKRVDFESLDLDSPFKLVPKNFHIGVEKILFWALLIFTIPLLIGYTIAVFILEEAPRSTGMLKEYWMIVSFGSLLLVSHYWRLRKLPLELIADNETVRIKLLWSTEIIEYKRDRIEMKFGSKMRLMFPPLIVKEVGSKTSFSFDPLKYRVELPEDGNENSPEV